jgi:hypothetical protein
MTMRWMSANFPLLMWLQHLVVVLTQPWRRRGQPRRNLPSSTLSIRADSGVVFHDIFIGCLETYL